jgi:molybdenum cofactor cytidylyltransferase
VATGGQSGAQAGGALSGGARAAGRLEAIVLAAGAGTRFGGGKLLAPWGIGTVLDGALAAALAAPVSSVVLATGNDAARVAEAARRLAARMGEIGRLRVVEVEDHAEGMGASLRAAAAALPADAAGAFVFLGDMPRVPIPVLAAMAAAVRSGAPAAAPVFEGRRGNPVLFGAALIPQLKALSGDKGARDILAGLGASLALVESPDDGVLFDIDRPEDLR